MVEHFRQLRIYQQAFDAAKQIYELSKRWPREERYSLIDQIRRSSRAVCANIAEAWCKRRYPAHFVSKLSDPDAETAETQVWLDFAFCCGYLSKEEFETLDAVYKFVSGGLVKMMSEPERWCGPSQLAKESAADYMEHLSQPNTSIPPYFHTSTHPEEER